MFDNDPSGKKFQEWVQSHIEYPEDLKKEEIQGRVYLSFRITKDGKLTDVKILRGLQS